MSDNKTAAKDSKAFESEQETLLATIAEKVKDAECGRISGLLTIGRLTSQYVSNALGRAADGMLGKAFTAAVKAVELKLAEVTDDATYGVSRLLGLSGLSALVDDGPTMNKLLPSQVKQLVRLIRRDAEAKDVAYAWKEKALAKGAELVKTVAAERWAIRKVVKAVDKMLEKKATDEPSAADSAAKRIASAFKLLRDKSDDTSRDSALAKLVKTDAVTAKDIFGLLKALAANQKLKNLAALGEACAKLAKRATGTADDTAPPRKPKYGSDKKPVGVT
jgi:hypothetical protein